MNDAWSKLVSCDQDVINIIRWWLVKKAPRKYLRMALCVGGVREVVQETCLSLIKSRNPDMSCHWSTAAINQTRWTLLRMYTTRMKPVSYKNLHELTISDEQVAIAMQNELAERISLCLNELSYRQRAIIELRMQGMTLDEVGDVMKVSRERIRQIEHKAMRILQLPHTAGRLVMFLDD